MDALVVGIELRLHLRDLGAPLRQVGAGGIVDRFLGIVILLGDELLLVKTFGALVIQAGMLGVGFGAVQIG